MREPSVRDRLDSLLPEHSVMRRYLFHNLLPTAVRLGPFDSAKLRAFAHCVRELAQYSQT